MVQNRIVIVSTGKNCEYYLNEWFSSLQNQTDKDFTVIAIDDNSDDDTAETLRELEECAEWLTVVTNKEWHSALYNQTVVLKNTIRLTNEDIICVLDLDDSLKDNAVERIRTIYEDPNVWLSYGSFEPKSFCTSKPLDWNFPMRQQWSTSSFRTYKWFLYKNIKAKDFKYTDGTWITEVADRLIMYPLLEMAGEEHVFYNQEIIYNYRMYEQNEYLCKPQSNTLVPLIQDDTPYEKKSKTQLVKGKCDWND